MVYDHAGRLTKVFQKNNTETTEEKIADQTYNELGQLIIKKAGKPATDATFLQTMNYRYNIRGWMTHINDAALTDATDLFGMELLYNTGANLSGTAITNGQFNGNIAAQKWKTKSDNTPVSRMFSYSYDPASRLSTATYTSLGSVLSEDFSVVGLVYDKNGNFKNFDQNGLRGYTTINGNQLRSDFGAIDRITYGYEGNRLIKADDGAGNTPNLANDFRNGNLTSDLNKGISDDLTNNIKAITYNHLNLPTRIHYGSTGTTYFKFYYSATGVKLRKEVYQNGSIVNYYDYMAGFVYERGKLEFFPTETGRAISPYFVQSTAANFVYEYNYKDHLGNLRLSFRQPRPTVTFTATMEDVNAATEEIQFANVAFTRKTGNAQSGTKSALLEYDRVLGPFKTIKVRTGDVLNAEVYAYYTSTAPFTPVTLSAFISNPSNVKGGTEGEVSIPLLNLGITINSAATPPAGAPKAYLKYIYYDEKYQYLSAQTVNVTSASLNAFQLYTLPTLTATHDGYVQVFVANEGDRSVWFDNLKITHTEALVVQENHYSPFGNNLIGITKKGYPDDKFQYNGKERQEELNLYWIDYGARFYDPQLGRWHTVDPMTESQESWTPYHYVYNNPGLRTDPDGRCPDGDCNIKVDLKGYKLIVDNK